MIVLDVSFMLALVLPDEKLDPHDARRIGSQAVCVPSIFPAELTNAIHQAERRGRIPQQLTARILSDISELAFTTAAPSFDLDEELALARAHDLTIYEACYLALAKRISDPVLATCDARLRRAAIAESIALIPT